MGKSIVVPRAKSEVLDVKSEPADKTGIPAIEVAVAEIGSPHDRPLAVYILNVGVDQVSGIPPQMQIEIRRKVDDRQHRQFQVTQVKTVFPAALDKIVVIFLCSLEAVEQFRLDRKPFGQWKLGKDTSIKSRLHTLV